MATCAYLVRIIVRPENEAVSDWMDWYSSECLPETLARIKATRGGLYRAYDTFELQTKTPLDGGETALHDMKLSQTIDFESPTDMVLLVMAQIQSIENPEDIFRLASPPVSGPHASAADIRLYKLIEDYDPQKLGHRRSPFVLNVQVQPADVDDYNTFYSGEHLHMLSRVPGYRRSQRYKFVTGQTKASLGAPQFMAVHEWDHLDALDGPELREADASVNTRRVFGSALKVNIRGFQNRAVYGDIQK
ncbi:hypothetical protein GE09DRAFT_1064162 [Coniochaeta sp. 2T2.1]|nr:hypothetical protein GE09DRAFT_1064162 [Coniochaeta sp. 2T2.1]